jgi:polyhydroxyalkanoate synthesis regulator phasin
MQDAWRAYLELVLGVTEVSRKKAREVAKDLLGRGGTTVAQVQLFVDDLVATSRANREGLAKLVRHEVDRAVSAVGLATAEEMAELTSRLGELERRLAEWRAGGSSPAATPPGRPPATAPPVPGEPPTAPEPAATKGLATKGMATKGMAKKAVAKKAVAKKAVAKKAVSPGTTPAAAGRSAARKSAG